MTYQLNISIPYYTNIPKDVVVNTWHFDWIGAGNPVAANYTAILSTVGAFYTAAYASAGAGGMAAFMRPLLATYKMYDLTDPTPRVPVASGPKPLTVTTAASVTTPTEFAVCLSYKGSYLSGINNASRRGRLYLGGWGNGTTTGGVSTFPAVSATVITNVAAAAAAVQPAALVNDWAWVVYSPTLNSSTDVTDGWIDDAPDTQRRRGQGATARTLWT